MPEEVCVFFPNTKRRIWGSEAFTCGLSDNRIGSVQNESAEQWDQRVPSFVMDFVTMRRIMFFLRVQRRHANRHAGRADGKKHGRELAQVSRILYSVNWVGFGELCLHIRPEDRGSF